MDLPKQPETEMEYFETIEAIGGAIFFMEHELADGRIPESTTNSAWLKDARETIEKLIAEIIEKFGVIHPKDCPPRHTEEAVPLAPEGKTYYWDWYYKMKEQYDAEKSKERE